MQRSYRLNHETLAIAPKITVVMPEESIQKLEKNLSKLSLIYKEL